MGEQEPLRFAAFVRNIMVGRNGLTADFLSRELQAAGGQEPKNFLSTGNLTFTASPRHVDHITAQFEKSIESVLGRREEVFVRSVEHLAKWVLSDPFASEMNSHVHERCVTFYVDGGRDKLKLPIETPNGDALLFANNPGEVLSVTRLVSGRPGKPGQVVESQLNTRATTRNWNTIERIVRLES